MTSPVEAPRVTTLELFFDLVFVFTLTQLTTVLFRAPNARGLLQVVLMLGVIWWMYGGYAWLTNAVSAHTLPRRLLLLRRDGRVLRACARDPDRVQGHGSRFRPRLPAHRRHPHRAVHPYGGRRARPSDPHARAVQPLGAPLIVLAGGAIGGTTQYVLWGATGRLPVADAAHPRHERLPDRAGALRGTARARRDHRHRRVGRRDRVRRISAHARRSACRRRARRASRSAPACGGCTSAATTSARCTPCCHSARSYNGRAALRAFGYWHIPMLLGIIAIAAVEREATAHPFSSLNWARATILAGGVSCVPCRRRRLSIRALARTHPLARRCGVASPGRDSDRRCVLAVCGDWIPGRVAARRHPRRGSAAVPSNPKESYDDGNPAHRRSGRPDEPRSGTSKRSVRASGIGSRCPTGATCRSSCASATLAC